MISATRRRKANQNGKTPRNISYMVTSLVIAEMANTFTPIGGVTTPSSTMTTTFTPNQIGSKPALIARGKKSGTALVVVLPAAIVVHSSGDLIDRLRRSLRDLLVVERGDAQDYAGAGWRLTEMTRLPGELPGTVIVLAEFEAAVADAGRLRGAAPCMAMLTDDRGRRWEPPFLPERAVRQARPDAVDKPRCGAFDGAVAGGTLAMAETFAVPEDARGLALSLTMTGALPDRLLFR